MQALILVGGEATRLRPLTCNMPKAMVPVLNTPFLEHVIVYLGSHGVRDVILAQGRLPKAMEDYFKDGAKFDSKLTYSLEKTAMNTAGAVKNAEQYLTDRFLVLNGDIFTDLDITAMLRFHQERNALVTIALTPVEDPTAYGLVETDSESRITRFLEKPSKEQITTNMINAGTYILERRVLGDIPAATNYSFERQLFPALLGRGERVYAFPSKSAYWIDIGKPDSYMQVHRDLLSGKARAPRSPENPVGRRCKVDPSARLDGQIVVGEGCNIGNNVRLAGPLVIGPGCAIEEGAAIHEAVIWQNARVGSRASISGSLIANDCRLGADCVIEKSVLGDHITVTPNTRLGPGSRIWPPG